ncbi:hypothetical protein L7F22_058279 [Adiantum nelumboides]|nr:hypothetical protein [Adiantum nelumboides]
MEMDPPNKDEGFQPVSKRNSTKGGKSARQGKNRAVLSPLLENIFEHFSAEQKDTREQGPDVPPEAAEDPHKEDKELFEDVGFDMDNPNTDLDNGDIESSSSDGEPIPNSQAPKPPLDIYLF